MEAYICFVFTLCVLLAGQASATDCGKRIFANEAESGNIQSNLTVSPCEIYILGNATVFFQVKNLLLSGTDSLEIYDVYNSSSKALIVSYSATDNAPFPVVVGLQPNITIIFKFNGTASIWTLDFNVDCTVNITNDWSHKVDSPKYLVTAGENFTCNYNIICNLPSDRIAALSFLSLSVFNNSKLNLVSGNDKAEFTETSNGEDFFADGMNSVALSFSVNTAGAQSFSIFVEPVVKDCSGKQPINKTLDEVTKPFSNPGVSFVCRWVVNSILPRFTAKINSLQIIGGYDLLTFIDGGSSRAAVSKSWSSAVDDSLFLSLGQKAVISLQLGDFVGDRNLNLSLLAAGAGGPILSQGELSVGDKQEDLTTYFQLTASPAGQLVKVDITDRKPDETSVVFYDGLQPSDPVLISLTNGGPNLKTVIGGANVLVVITRVSQLNVFKATFSSLDPGCDQLATGNSGSWNYKATSNATGACRYTVVPNKSGLIVLYLDSFTLRLGDSLKVFSGLETSTPIAQFAVPTGEITIKEFQLLQVHGSATEGIGVVLTRNTNDTKSLSQAAVRYEVVDSVCGGELMPRGDITTPNYPNLYPINAKCSWTINEAMPGQLILLTFQSLSLAPGHSLEVTENNTVVASYGGTVTPVADLLVTATNLTKIEFKSPSVGDSSPVATGAQVSYLRPNCGANLTKFTDNITVPSLSAGSLCVWSIDVKNKTNSTNIVKFTIAATDKITTDILTQSLKIFDGESLKSKTLDIFLNVANYSRGDRLVIKLELTQNLTVGFNISFRTQTCSATCQNGICMRADWLCNNINDCGDNTDELNCYQSNGTTTVPPTTQKPEEADYSGWVKSGWVPACLFIGILIGLVLYFVVPKLYRRIRGGGGNYSRMGDDRPVVT